MAKRTVEILLKAKDQTKKAVKSTGDGFKKLQTTLAANATAIAAFGAAAVAALGLATVAVFKFLDATATMEDNLAKAARRAQIDIQTYGEWAFVFERAGASASTVEKSVQALVKQLGAASIGTKETVDAFKELGVEFENNDGTLKSGKVAFEEVISKLADMTDETKRSYLSMLLLGRGGKMLIPVLAQSSAEIQKQRDLYTELGGASITMAAETGEAWVDAQLHIKTAKDGIRASFLSAFGPDIVTLMNGVASSIALIGDEMRDLDSVEIGTMADFVQDMELAAAMAVPTIKLLNEIDKSLKVLGTGVVWKFDEQIDEMLEAVQDFQAAAADAALARYDLEWGPSSDDVTGLTEYNDLLKLSREELESIAKARGIPVTAPAVFDQGETKEVVVDVKYNVEEPDEIIVPVKYDVEPPEKIPAPQFDLSDFKPPQLPPLVASGPILDIPKTSDQLAKELANSFKAAVPVAQEEINASPDTKIKLAVDLEGGEALADNLQGHVVLYEDIIAAQDSVKQGADEWNEKVILVNEQMAKLWELWRGFADPVPVIVVDDYTESILEAVDAADTLGTSLGTSLGSAAFRKMKGEAVDFQKVLIGSVVAALEQVIIKLLVIQAIKLFSGIPGLSDGGGVPGRVNGGGVSKVPGAAFGYSVPDGIRGRDSRLIMAAPGEEVINRQLSQRLNRFITAQESAAYASPYGAPGQAGGGGGTVVFNMGLPDTMAAIDRIRENMVETLNEGGSV